MWCGPSLAGPSEGHLVVSLVTSHKLWALITSICTKFIVETRDPRTARSRHRLVRIGPRKILLALVRSEIFTFFDLVRSEGSWSRSDLARDFEFCVGPGPVLDLVLGSLVEIFLMSHESCEKGRNRVGSRFLQKLFSKKFCFSFLKSEKVKTKCNFGTNKN